MDPHFRLWFMRCPRSILESTENHAYQIGLSGQVYEGVCSGTEDAQRFRMEWQRGWDEFSNDY